MAPHVPLAAFSVPGLVLVCLVLWMMILKFLELLLQLRKGGQVWFLYSNLHGVGTSVDGTFKPAISTLRSSAACCAAFNANLILLSELLGLFLLV